MKILVNKDTKAAINVGDTMLHEKGATLRLCGVINMCEPESHVLVVASDGNGMLSQHFASSFGAELVDAPYAGPRGNPAVTFNTAVHSWKFETASDIMFSPSSPRTGRIAQRLYGADDGNPYYRVLWFCNSGADGSTLEPAARLETLWKLAQ